MKIAGLDIGTTGCKCTVFDESGAYLNKSYRDYPVKRTVGGHEIDVSVVMDGVFEVIREMSEQYPDIAGIGVTSFGETCVFADETGMPLCPSMLYTDPRGKDECAELENKIGQKRIAEITGLRPHEMYSISKIMWMKKNRPEIWKQTKHIFLMEDFVIYHLTGKKKIDYSLASRTMALDIGKLKWSEQLFNAAEIDIDLMSEVVPTGTSVGTITEKAVRTTGLSKNTEVVCVSHDQISAAIGAGAFDETVAVDGAGTVECLTPIYASMPNIEEMYKGYYSVVPYVIPGTYVAYAFSYTGGALIQWCIEQLAKQEKTLSKNTGMSVNSMLEEAYLKQKGDKPSELLVLPHFAGAATPYMDTGSKGAVLGLTVDTKLEDIYRGCMEGVVYEMYLNMQALQQTGTHFTRLHATGGGAKSEVWMQMKADMLNVPITVLETIDAGTVGSAMLTGIAVGAFKNLEDAASHMVIPVKSFEPRADMHEKYLNIYEKYKNVYRAIRPLI